MMRDYKFQRSEWAPRKPRRGTRRILPRLLLLAIIAGAGYAAITQLAPLLPQKSQQDTSLPPNVIPLQLPPNRPHDSAKLRALWPVA